VRWPDGGGSITNGTICVAQGILLALVWLGSRRARAANRELKVAADVATSANVAALSPRDALPTWLRVGIALAACYAVTMLLNGFSGIYGFDAFSDHLARPARWLAAGRLVRGMPVEFITFYPGNFELLVRWTLSLGTDRLAFLVSFGSCAAAVWVVYRIALELEQSRTAAVMSALAAASLQVLAYQSTLVMSDSYTALCLLLATWLLLVCARDGATDDRLNFAFGVALGLSLGAKYSAGPPGVILGLVWLWLVWRTAEVPDDFGGSRTHWGKLLTAMAWLSAGMVAVMGYWYLRNAVELRNPLYPLSIAGLPGIPIAELLFGAPGPKTTMDRLTYAWTERGHVFGFETGLGPMFASVVMVAACAAPFYRRRAGSSQRLLSLILLGVWVAWWRTGVLVPRYGLFPLLLSFVLVGELWSSWPSRLLGTVFGVVVCATMFSIGHELLASVAYNELLFDPKPKVPVVLDSLPPSRILNLAGEPSGYYAMGRGARHRVISLLKMATSDDVRRLAPDFVLLPQAREPEFVPTLGLQLMGRWEKSGAASTSLWRVPAAAARAP